MYYVSFLRFVQITVLAYLDIGLYCNTILYDYYLSTI